MCILYRRGRNAFHLVSEPYCMYSVHVHDFVHVCAGSRIAEVMSSMESLEANFAAFYTTTQPGEEVCTTTCIHTCIFSGSVLSRVWSVVGSIPTRGGSFFLRKVTALGVLCCFALLFV